ncbi:MAG: inorganic phosphate transporter [Cyclobacteriaceae bacterium]
MESYYIFIVVILIILAVSDLVVGVSNDAVNFLNSSIGSKAASFKLIMFIAALGILFGATFSSGMMEVARKGIFHPDQFFFSEIMIIFLAVMMTDILLLDLFNTFALPTSTTVSIVFELLGAAVAVSLIKISVLGDSAGALGNYINTSSALLIITGILLSVVIAFTIGLIVQWLVRLIFSFDYAKTLKYWGSVWGGFAISIITYFILIKGAKGSSFLTSETVDWIRMNTFYILLFSFVGWTIILQLIYMVFKFNILKIIVLVGTFALAMAFAGNDLVNFVGVPLAGLESLTSFLASEVSDPGTFVMTSLSGKIQTPTYMLLLAGLVMVIALYKSKKARSVTATEINLSRQDEGYERFESSMLARSLVRGTLNLSVAISKIVPAGAQGFITRKFNQKAFNERKKQEGISFDLVRASVNLVVASALISLATSLKLPLSTTYVTFMVAMGTSLADKAWGRDSAVYRISGVITVIGGWFFTAFSAFTAAFILAYLIHIGGLATIILLILTIIFLVFKSYKIHQKREKEKVIYDESEMFGLEINGKNILTSCNENVIGTLTTVSGLYNKSMQGLIKFKRKSLVKVEDDILKLDKNIKHIKNSLPRIIEKLQEDDIESGHYYVQVVNYLKETVNALKYISKPIYTYIDNNHKPLIEAQENELNKLSEDISNFFSSTILVLKEKGFVDIEGILIEQKGLIDRLTSISKQQLKRIKNQESGTKNSTLYLNIMYETKNLLLFTVNLIKAQRDFLVFDENQKTQPVGENT